jgi:translocation and assembly module TamB
VVEATGQASFEGLRLHRYLVNATARGARVQVEPYFRGVVDGGVEASGDARRARVAGRVTLSSGELVVAAPPAQAAGAGPFPVELDLEMAAGQGLAVVAGPVRLQAGGRLHVGGTLASPALSGTVTARGGEYRAFGTTFVVEEGAAVFQEFRGTEPLLTARASTRVGDVTVFVHLAGTPGQMQLRLSSDPELPYERIVQLLAAHAGIQRALGGEVEAALRQQLARFLLGEFERRVRQLLGLAELRIEYDFEKPLRLRLGRFLLRDLYLTLTTVFDTETRFLWALEYRFARHYAFAFSHDTAGVWMVLLRANFTW